MFVDEPNSSEPAKGLKEGGVSGVRRYVLAGKRRMGQKTVSFSHRKQFVLTLFIFKAPNYVLARTLTERVV